MQESKRSSIILYYDDLGITNSLGANVKNHKLSMFYWTLANIDPEIRSIANTIQLFPVVKTELLKKSGIKKILQPFVSDIITLQREGITINIKGNIKTFKGSLLFCAGDTPASALLGDFKESVAAHRLCRTCLATQKDLKLHFSEDVFCLRNKFSHRDHVDLVNQIYQNV